MSEAQRVVLISVDASENAKSAVNFYLSEVYRKNDLVVLCHIPEIADLPSFSFRAGLAPPVDEWKAAIFEQQTKVKQLEDFYERQFTPQKISYKTHFEACKTPGQGIVAASEAHKAALVVIGTRGLDRLRRTLLGSVSDYVVRHSKVPVLVCPLPGAD